MRTPQNCCKTTHNMEDTECIYGMGNKFANVFVLTHFHAVYFFLSISGQNVRILHSGYHER